MILESREHFVAHFCFAKQCLLHWKLNVTTVFHTAERLERHFGTLNEEHETEDGSELDLFSCFKCFTLLCQILKEAIKALSGLVILSWQLDWNMK